MSLWVLLFVHFPPGHSVSELCRNLDVVINEKRHCVRRRVFDTLREHNTHWVDVQVFRWTIGWRANQRKRRITRELWSDFAQDVKPTVVHHVCFLIPIIVGLRVERLPGIFHLSCTTR